MTSVRARLAAVPTVVWVAIAAIWLGAGALGISMYGQSYAEYRGYPPPKDPPGVAKGREVTVSFHSEALHATRQYGVYLPAGYADDVAHGMRFGVVYLLHGNPVQPRVFYRVAQIGVMYDQLQAQCKIRPFLVVTPEGQDGTKSDDTEWADTPHGRYGSFVIDVVHDVDQRFPTIADRRHRVIAGYSMGAYGAANLTIQHPEIFGAFESWSGYFRQTHDHAFAHATAAELRDASPIDQGARIHWAVHHGYPLRAYVYVGARDPGRVQQAGFVRLLRREGVPTTAKVVPGRHDWAVWRPMVPAMLRWADARMYGPSPGDAASGTGTSTTGTSTASAGPTGVCR